MPYAVEQIYTMVWFNLWNNLFLISHFTGYVGRLSMVIRILFSVNTLVIGISLCLGTISIYLNSGDQLVDLQSLKAD